ncbi:T-cell surface glycoprotein CD3 zeta chain [Solea senegalensis]|uniref:T-cell surface glycoprotein CD3 zeta chain n=1 Tax=Solea senegalensis TaxID=28829 RepID=A0AAV6RBT4_SOLSE|nr:T-cell surface glycoprotein CD3 zeta chain [Solea senegalensis]
MHLYDPGLCYILDGFLGLYGLIITGMFIKERFFKAKVKSGDDAIYTDLKTRSDGGYDGLMRDTERGRNRWTDNDDATYTGLNRRTEGEYKELPVKREVPTFQIFILFVSLSFEILSLFVCLFVCVFQRQRKTEKVYQDLSSVTRDTYDSLQMQPLPAR